MSLQRTKFGVRYVPDDTNADLKAAARILAEGWFQRNHPDSPGVTVSDSQMAEAAYEVRAALAPAKS